KKVSFDLTWGLPEVTALLSVPVLPILVAELEKAANWLAILPAANTLSVSLRPLPTDGAGLVLHPLGRLAVSQRAVPLELDLDKVGGQRPADGTRFSLDLTGAGLTRSAEVDEAFAVGQFRDLDDADALSQPAFERLASGLQAAPAEGDHRS